MPEAVEVFFSNNPRTLREFDPCAVLSSHEARLTSQPELGWKGSDLLSERTGEPHLSEKTVFALGNDIRLLRDEFGASRIVVCADTGVPVEYAENLLVSAGYIKREDGRFFLN